MRCLWALHHLFELILVKVLRFSFQSVHATSLEKTAAAYLLLSPQAFMQIFKVFAAF